VAGILDEVLVDGTLFGLSYVLVAVGFTLLFGVSKVLNLAYGALYMVTAYMIYFLAVQQGVDLLLATGIAIAVAVAVGIAVFALCLKFAPDPMRFLIVSLLVAFLLQYIFEYPPLFGGDTGLTIPSLVSTQGFLLLGESVNWAEVVTAVVGLATLALLWGWIDYTGYGRAIRATSEDPETASLFGIRPRSVYLVVVAVSSSVIALAAVLISPTQYVTPSMWVNPFIIAFVVALVGGLGYFKWTLPAAFLVSFCQFFVDAEWPSYSGNLSEIVYFVVAAAFIIALPRGIGGIHRDVA
jgi:branched-chain amino acid transport system permease protein